MVAELEGEAPERVFTDVATRVVPAECRFVFPVTVVAAFAPTPAPNTRPRRSAPKTFNDLDTGDPPN